MDLVELTETLYDVRLPEQEWLSGVTRGIRHFLPASLGAVTWQFELGKAIEVSSSVAVIDGPEAWAGLPHLFAQVIPESDAAYRSVEPTLATDVYTQEYWDSLVPPGIKDGRALIAHDPHGATLSGAICFFPLEKVEVMRPRQRRLSTQLASHFGAALRLRRRVAETEALFDKAAGVVETSGAIASARGEFGSAEGQARLRQMARLVDTARATALKDPEEALTPWTALSQGRWSMLDQFDSDGRRYFVVVDNSLEVPDPRGMTQRERDATAFAAVGYSNKAIAYHLGLEESTVSKSTKAGMRKLGVTRREELIRGFSKVAEPSDGDG